MMSSQSMQTLIDPGCRNKMPLFDGTAGSKPQTVPGILGKQALQYHGAYFAYDPRLKDGAAFTQAWSKAKMAQMLDGRSPVSHLGGMEGRNHVVYRQDSSSSEEGHSHSSSLCHAQGKPGFTLYAKSPGVSSPTAAANQKTGGESVSPLSESPVYLAVPKPVYRHSPCCSELGCVMGQRYTMEHGSPRRPSAVYEHDWMQAGAHYAERPPAPVKAPGLQPDHGAEPVQRMVEAYSPSRARAFPVLIDPNYSSYPCTPTRALFTSLSEQSQCLQTPPRGYPSFYPPHASYEHMTSDVYQECSPMSKYGQLTQHPILYYPQSNVELESRAQCKDMSAKQREHVPVILKHTMSNPREHFIVPQALHGEIPLPTAEALPNRPFLRGLDYPCYAVPRFHLNAGQVRHPLKTQHVPPGYHASGVGASPSGQHMDPSAASGASVHRDKPSAGLRVDKAHGSSPFLHEDRTSPARRTSQPGISPQGIQGNRFLPPLTSLHLDRPILPPAGMNIDRLIDLNPYEAQISCPKLQRGLPVSPAAWLPRSPCSDSFPSLVTHLASARKAIYSPPASAADEHSSTASRSGSAAIKECLKRRNSQSSPPVKIKEDADLFEVEPIRKRLKVEMEGVRPGTKNNSPPMPVIDNVFSLAPYQAYLQASSMLLQVRSLQRTVQLAEHREIKPKPEVKENRTGKDERQAGATPVPPRSRSDSSSEKPVAEIIEPDNIKVEKVEPPDTKDSVETPVTEKDCSEITIKQEPEETGASDDGLVIKMCEPEELERKPMLDEVSEESNPADLTPSSQGDADALRDQAAVLQPKSTTPPKTPVSFKNIPPQCLKLSTYKILLPDSKSSSPISPQALVRKHFLELHHSLCALVSKTVSGSSEQELRAWFAQLKLPAHASSSAKVQKVSCLLGAEAREAWLNEETKAALDAVLERLREYTAQKRCPFPHVMRAGAVFLPMLVVKELLFAAVPGGLVDQVLQEHKVELRPTTLSEEKILIQLHKHACSSRLRRLMSLKHLPDIYGDVLNLFYYSCVCKRLGLDTDEPAIGEHSCRHNSSCSPADVTSSPESPSKDLEPASHLNRNRTDDRARSSFRYTLLDTSLSDEEDCASAGVLDTLRNGDWGDPQSEDTGHTAAGDSSLIPQSATCENSWMCPLSLEGFSSSDTEAEESSSLQTLGQSPGPAKPAAGSESCSGVILKLRRMFSEGLKRKRACYEAVANTEAFPDASLPQTEGEVEVTYDGDLHRASPKASRKWQRTGNVSHALRPLCSSSKRKHSSLLKIKYCPYLSACHSAEHRRRWVLRSAVQRARRAMRFYYPDLVGKRIHHLYEEDDKSEVWYKGEVLRVHEAHSNPLKTVFEVRYDSEPEWKYYLELLIDYKKGWLKIED
ncbi:uncharacterized protein C15orf39 homolog [Betta splendens]|uniref:Uncharacterized protein C15orf39 homolog n=1 Tax=Betta splendens TaxID=158456 RepID=A0A6P7MQ34_BETSP|nr:uncharacterized protein C15orf39 homolog [Betta splendens]